MTVIQRTPNLGIGIRMKRVAPPAPVVSQAPAPVVELKPPFWSGIAEWWEVPNPVTHLDVTAYEFNPPGYMYPVSAWTAVVEGATDVQWRADFTPVITTSTNAASPSADKIEAWRGETVDLLAPTEPNPGHPYSPRFLPIPSPLEVYGAEFAPDVYWNGFDVWALEIFGGDNLTMMAPVIYVANGCLMVFAYGRCLSGELVATASHDGVDLGQVSLTLTAINVLSIP